MARLSIHHGDTENTEKKNIEVLIFQFRISSQRQNRFNINNFPPCPLCLRGEKAFHSFTFRKRNEFVITETELRLMAAAAKMGFSVRWKTG
jgi:hypothetical protein